MHARPHITEQHKNLPKTSGCRCNERSCCVAWTAVFKISRNSGYRIPFRTNGADGEYERFGDENDNSCGSSTFSIFMRNFRYFYNRLFLLSTITANLYFTLLIINHFAVIKSLELFLFSNLY